MFNISFSFFQQLCIKIYGIVNHRENLKMKFHFKVNSSKFSKFIKLLFLLISLIQCQSKMLGSKTLQSHVFTMLTCSRMSFFSCFTQLSSAHTEDMMPVWQKRTCHIQMRYLLDKLFKPLIRYPVVFNQSKIWWDIYYDSITYFHDFPPLKPFSNITDCTF